MVQFILHLVKTFTLYVHFRSLRVKASCETIRVITGGRQESTVQSTTACRGLSIKIREDLHKTIEVMPIDNSTVQSVWPYTGSIEPGSTCR